jgi:DHA1 family bicyclomycin/chloramphenicol resistance-like MFS transporter
LFLEQIIDTVAKSPAPHNFTLVLAIMVLAGSGSIMSTDLYAPSLPYLTEFFGTTPELLKLTISLNLIVYGFAQLIYGPLSDRFGRRPVFLGSIILFSIASLACAFAQSIDQLLIARVLQGFFAAAEAVMCLAVFKDLFTEQEQVKGFAIYGMSIALAPAVAPVLGGYIHVLFGWEYNFYLMAAIGTLTAFLIFLLLPESTTPDPHALKIKSIARNYMTVIRNPVFMVYGVLAGLALGLIYAFVTGAPFILISYFGVEIQHFGYYQAAIVVPFFLGSMLATRLVDFWPSVRVFNLGLTVLIFGAVMVVGFVFIGGLSPYSLTFAYLFIAFGLGPVFAVATSKAMAAVERSAGSAAAMFGSLEIGLSGVIAAMVSVFHDDTPAPFGIVVGLTGLAALVLGVIANRMNSSVADASPVAER